MQWIAIIEFCNEQQMVFHNERLKQRVIFYYEQLPQRVTNDFFCNEQLPQRLKSDFLQWATSVTSNGQILQWMTNDFKTSNKQQVNFNN